MGESSCRIARHRRPPTVFISYAHESDALRASVATLAEWLGRHGCRVLTDHPFVDRPPPEGWVVWMLGCIEEADTGRHRARRMHAQAQGPLRKDRGAGRRAGGYL
jgi:hypothetical protein